MIFIGGIHIIDDFITETILSLVKENDGILTLSLLSSTLNVSIIEGEKILDAYVAKNMATKSFCNGNVFYKFSSIYHED